MKGIDGERIQTLDDTPPWGMLFGFLIGLAFFGFCMWLALNAGIEIGVKQAAEDCGVQVEQASETIARADATLAALFRQHVALDSHPTYEAEP